MSAIPRTTPESLHYGDHQWAIRVNGAGESHWSMSHGPENIYSDRRCNFCRSSVAPPVASLHGVASYDRRLDSADVGKLDCFRRSGRLELLRIKTPHAASLIAASCPCCAALKIGSKCLCWVILDWDGQSPGSCMSASTLCVQPVNATPLVVYRLAFGSPRSFADVD